MQGDAPRNRNRNENGTRSPLRSVTASSCPSVAVQLDDLARGPDDDAGPLELVDQVVGHRLSEVAAAMEERDERAAAGEPDGSLAGRVAAADRTCPRGSAELRLRRSGRIEDAQPFVFVESIDGQPPVLCAGRDQDRARRDARLTSSGSAVGSTGSPSTCHEQRALGT